MAKSAKSTHTSAHRILSSHHLVQFLLSENKVSAKALLVHGSTAHRAEHMQSIDYCRLFRPQRRSNCLHIETARRAARPNTQFNGIKFAFDIFPSLCCIRFSRKLPASNLFAHFDFAAFLARKVLSLPSRLPSSPRAESSGIELHATMAADDSDRYSRCTERLSPFVLCAPFKSKFDIFARTLREPFLLLYFRNQLFLSEITHHPLTKAAQREAESFQRSDRFPSENS